MNIRRTIKKSTRQYFIVAIICILVIGIAATIVTLTISGAVKEDYEAKLAMAYNELEENQRVVYVAVTDIPIGDYITNEKVEQRKVYVTQPQETFMNEDDIGKISLINIPKDTQIIKTMISEKTVSSEIREVEYDVIHINSNIVSNDTVDVRITYPNGESYIVLSKKIIKGYDPEAVNCFFWLDEEEILRMSAAIVDAGLYTGTKLITTKYIEPSIQDESIVTYTPSLSVLELIENDPNIVERCSQELNKEVRKSLENRLSKSMDIDVKDISWNVRNDVFPTTDENYVPVPTPTPTPLPIEVGSNNDINTMVLEDVERNYLFYAEEERAREGDIEYGE